MKSHLAILRRVRGAVSTRDLVPVLTHFHFYGGRVQGTNGHITVDSVLPGSTLDGTVPAERFIKVLDRCTEEITLSQDAHHLTVKSGRFKAKIAFSQDPFPLMRHLAVDGGVPFMFQPAMWYAVQAIQPFIGTDASRPWSRSALIRGAYVYATNNVVLVRSLWAGVPSLVPEGMTDVMLPESLIDEMSRHHEPITGALVSENALQIDYREPGSTDPAFWIRAVRNNESWPNVAPMFATLDGLTLPEVPEGLHTAVETVAPFCVDVKLPVVRFGPGGVSTMEGDHMASIEGFDLPEAAFLAPHLLPALNLATHVDFSPFPGPCPFWQLSDTGTKHIEGLILGVRI